MEEAVLQVQDLHTFFHTPRGILKAVDGVSFNVHAGKIRAIVGESGSGKSMTALSITQLLPEPAGYVDSGKVIFQGEDLLELTWSDMRHVRGKEIGMIFQEPMTSLNPTFTIGNQIREAAIVHGKTKEEAHSLALELLDKVGITDGAGMMRQYPHELSGGMRQRVMIAIALINRPKLLIADEPTTALDVTVQAQILALIRQMQKEFDMAVLLITHDLGVVAEVADEVSVMYAGQIVEDAPVKELFRSPRHPYTQDLLESLPRRQSRGKDLAVIAGTVPDATNWPVGCRYANRCRLVQPPFREVPPPMIQVSPTSQVRCHLYNPEMMESKLATQGEKS
jgi:oligopeptide/dipeptide ABC transporter ATP-binding protein